MRTSNTGIYIIKAGLLLFWALWFTLAFSTNFFDLLKALHHLPISWQFNSGNYQAVAQVISRYHGSSTLLNTLFVLDITAQLLIAIAFWVTFIRYITQKPNYFAWINLTFGISVALWAVFILIEEIFIAYQFETTHIRLLVFELISLLSIHLLADQKQPEVS